MISFTCPCGKALQAGDEEAGRGTRCPDCGREIAVPGGEGVPTADAPTPISRLAVVSAVLGVLAVALNGGNVALIVMTSGDADCLALFIAAGSLLTGLSAVVLAQRARKRFDQPKASPWSKRLARFGKIAGVLNVLAIVLVVTVLPAFFLVCDAGHRLQDAMNLHKIGIAMYCYNGKGTYPPAAIYDSGGKPILSWRVAILPYIGRDDLYQRFHLDEPWDGPNNSQLLSQMPKEYVLLIDSTAPAGYTYFRVFVGNGAAFEPDRGVRYDEFTDGTGNTILVVEAATAVPWTKPEELDYDPDGPLPPLGGHFGRHGHSFWVICGDGSERRIRQDISGQTLRAAITRAGHDALGSDW